MAEIQEIIQRIIYETNTKDLEQGKKVLEETRQVEGELKKEIVAVGVAQKAATDPKAIADYSKQLEGLQTKYKSVTGEVVKVEDAVEGLIKAAQAAGLDTLFSEEDLQKLQEGIENSKDEFEELAVVVEALKDELVGLEEGTEAFENLNAIIETGEEILTNYSEISEGISFGEGLKFGVEAIQAVTASLEIGAGAAALFGVEEEKLQEVQTKLIALIAVANGLQQLSNSLKKEGTLATVASQLATRAASAAQAAYNIVLGTSTGALRLFRIALAATGIGAVIVLIGSLVANWDKLTAGIGKASQAQERYNRIQEASIENSAEEIATLESLYSTTQDTTLSIEQREQAVQELQDLYPAYFANVDKEIILNGNAASSYNLVRDAIISTARVKAADVEIQKIVNDGLQKEIPLINERNKLEEKRQVFLARNDTEGDQRAEGLEGQLNTLNRQITAIKERTRAEVLSTLNLVKQDKITASIFANNQKTKVAPTVDSKKTTENVRSGVNDAVDKVNDEKKTKPLIIPTQADTDISQEGLSFVELGPDRAAEAIRNAGTVISEGEKLRRAAAQAGASFDERQQEAFRKIREKDAAELLAEQLQNVEQIRAAFESIGAPLNNLISSIGEQFAREVEAIEERIQVAQTELSRTQEIADRGNAELYNEQRDRLAQLEAQKEIARKREAEAAKVQNILNNGLAFSYSLAAIAKAGLEGGGIGSIATISALLGALASGLAFAQSFAAPALKDGTERFDMTGGKARINYSGNGVDKYPAWLDKGERVVDSKTNNKLKSIFGYDIPNHELPEKLAAGLAALEMPLPVIGGKLLSNSIQQTEDSKSLDRMEAMLTEFGLMLGGMTIKNTELSPQGMITISERKLANKRRQIKHRRNG